MSETHLIDVARIGRVKCQAPGCSELASRYARCKTCREVIAKCSAHGGDIERQRSAHCPR